jgi:hypothetical protein
MTKEAIHSVLSEHGTGAGKMEQTKFILSSVAGAIRFVHHSRQEKGDAKLHQGYSTGRPASGKDTPFRQIS